MIGYASGTGGTIGFDNPLEPLMWDFSSQREETALIAAVTNDHAEIVRFLLEFGADIHIQTAVGCDQYDVACSD